MTRERAGGESGSRSGVETGTSYFGVRDPRHAERDLERFAGEGLSAVLHTFSERDRLYYRDTMSEILDAGADRGLTTYVNPWGVGRVFGGEALSEFIGRQPQARQRLSTGDALPAACFNHPEFRQYMRGWVEDAVAIGADVVFWDEPHWYIPEWHGDSVPEGAWTCRCDACQERYRERYDAEMPAAETDRVAAFREDSLVEFLDEMMGLVRELGARNALCLLPGAHPDHGIRDWERLAASEHLDVFATDPYWAGYDEDPESYVRENTELVVDLANEHDLESQIWIQGFKLDADAADAVRTATRTALEGGVDSVFTWGWDGCRVISDIACEDPEAVWRAYLDELP